MRRSNILAAQRVENELLQLETARDKIRMETAQNNGDVNGFVKVGMYKTVSFLQAFGF